MKKIISLISGLGLLGTGYIWSIGPIGAIPIVGNIGAVVGGKAIGGLKQNLKETLSNADITLMIAQIFFIVILVVLLTYCFLGFICYLNGKKKKKFLFAISCLEMEVLTKKSPDVETISLITEYMKTYSKKLGERSVQRMHGALNMVKGEIPQEEKRHLIRAMRHAVKLM